MARPLRIQYPGAYYHVTCRGNEQKEIFLYAEDQKVFMEKLSLSLDIYNVSLLAYVCKRAGFLVRHSGESRNPEPAPDHDPGEHQ